ncbi:stalk domain-containing protein [Paenibacillus sp. FSL H8-0457]|uniref:leucine-rich repeat domain-containing protein n=1 Tax=unclassified Paenibacillus TaxID=185978 RepID=UPI0003E206B9|nr:stalk domain-containing protein [Paenibacillus sp. FSL H8-457]ETT66801.1 copper amine oxidase domain-containing protein [Paenibacillus sp. FSL H8-457]
MNKVLSGLVLILVMMISLPGQASMEQASLEVSFQDEQLEQAIKQILKKDGNAAVTQKDMESLTLLDLSRRGIKSIQGLQYASNVTYLDLSDNEIDDITPLMPLTKIRELDIADNQIASIEDLSDMTDLEMLIVNRNQISSIDVIKQLGRLHTFEANDNQISNITALSMARELTWLQLNGNQIANIQPLSRLTKLKNLEIASNQFSDLSPLKPLSKSLMSLNIGSNRISDLRALEGMTLMRVLSADNNQIKKLDPLKKMSNLSSLSLNSNLVYNLEPLKSLKELQYLYLKDNRVWSLDPIRNHSFDTHYDTGALRYALQLSGNYLDLRSTTKTYQLLNKLGGDGSRQLKAQRLVIGSRTAYIGESSFGLSEAPFIASSRTYVPIRFVSERLGSKVGWNQSKQEVTISKDNTTIRWKVNEKKANVNGKTVSFDAPLLLKKNSSFIPVRFVSELLGSPVEYVANPKTVIIFDQK